MKKSGLFLIVASFVFFSLAFTSAIWPFDVKLSPDGYEGYASTNTVHCFDNDNGIFTDKPSYTTSVTSRGGNTYSFDSCTGRTLRTVEGKQVRSQINERYCVPRQTTAYSYKNKTYGNNTSYNGTDQGAPFAQDERPSLGLRMRYIYCRAINYQSQSCQVLFVTRGRAVIADTRTVSYQEVYRFECQYGCFEETMTVNGKSESVARCLESNELVATPTNTYGRGVGGRGTPGGVPSNTNNTPPSNTTIPTNTTNPSPTNNTNQTHLACVNNACVSVSGSGTNTCTSNSQCAVQTNYTQINNTKLVFVTNESVNTSNFITPAGADAYCLRAKQRAGLPGNYVAWVSFANLPAKDRIPEARYVRRDGAFVGTKTNILASGPSVPISINEYNQILPSSFVLTGTDYNGAVTNSANCNNWANNTETSSYQAIIGTSTSTGLWTNSGWSICKPSYVASRNYRLYCFET